METNEQKINRLKVELFDIIENQHVHQNAVQQLEQMKVAKLKELEAVRQANATDTKSE